MIYYKMSKCCKTPNYYRVLSDKTKTEEELIIFYLENDDRNQEFN